MRKLALILLFCSFFITCREEEASSWNPDVLIHELFDFLDNHA